MILDEYVEIIGNSKNKKYYIEKGYNIEIGKKTIVKITDLSHGSTFKVNINCDKCQISKKIEWGTYLKYVKYDLTQPYLCINCVGEKRLKTNNIKYGGNAPACSKDIVDKIKNTNIERYGNPSTLHGINQKKTEAIFLEKYGFNTPFKNDNVKNKIKSSMIDRHGNGTYLGSDLHNKKNLNYMSKKYNLNIIDLNKRIYSILCSNCSKIYEINSDNIHRRHKNYTEEKYICTICNPIGSSYSSSYESIICDFLDQYNIQYIRNDQKVINPYHIDIYIPSHNLGIEFNGLYWHSWLKKDKKYHLDKYNLCLSKGIKLLQIWEDDWRYKNDIIKAIILNKLNLISNEVKNTHCTIKQIFDINIIKDFLNKNDIKGYINCSVSIGAYFNNELVSIIGFKKIKNNYKLVNLCSKIDFNIPNIEILLFNHFKVNFNFDKIVAYSDNTISNDELYEKLEFKYEKTSLNYYWTDFNLKNFKQNTNKNLTKIWNAGNKKWLYTK